ncbi:MAG: hypothetical protein JXA15_07645 [Spirochaetales bacterium]|nr:hypothetical protein [Spirochaetales bacterium]
MAELDGRFPAWAGAGAFALSALTGIVARVRIGPLAVRAFASGLVFAGVAAGAWFLARRFLPELFEPSEQAAGEIRDGARVDIVVGEDGEPGEYRAEGQAASDRDSEAVAGETRAYGPVDNSELDTEAEELRVETLVPVEPGTTARPSGPARPPVSFDDLDVLPDLDGFSDSFASPTHGSEEEAAAMESAALPRRSSGAADGMDPAAIAQAVRTILKKDRKG